MIVDVAMTVGECSVLMILLFNVAGGNGRMFDVLKLCGEENIEKGNCVHLIIRSLCQSSSADSYNKKENY